MVGKRRNLLNYLKRRISRDTELLLKSSGSVSNFKNSTKAEAIFVTAFWCLF